MRSAVAGDAEAHGGQQAAWGLDIPTWLAVRLEAEAIGPKDVLLASTSRIRGAP
jgi:hypothetical protein